MRLLDKPLSQKEIQNNLDTLYGNISRICCSDNPEEIIRSLGFATERLSMVAYSRIKELKERNE